MSAVALRDLCAIFTRLSRSQLIEIGKRVGYLLRCSRVYQMVKLGTHRCGLPIMNLLLPLALKLICAWVIRAACQQLFQSSGLLRRLGLQGLLGLDEQRF